MIEHEVLMRLMQYFSPLTGKIDILPVFGGRNNRSYCTTINEKSYFIKHYNKNIHNDQDRLQAEYAFLAYANWCNCSYVSRPVFADKKLAVGVYEFINGKHFRQGVGLNEIIQAIDFIQSINHKRTAKEAQHLACAAEACFSLAEHFNRVEQRVKHLQTIVINDDIDQEAENFINQQVLPAWKKIQENAFLKIIQKNLSLTLQLDQQDKIISPSDFGFHNALLKENGEVKFTDFEYAGWDDPAKLIGDFFNQIEVPVSLEYLSGFTESIALLINDKEQMKNRVEILLPVYRIKWICITLNYFLANYQQKKEFIAEVTRTDKISQLKKAQKILNSLNDLNEIGQTLWQK